MSQNDMSIANADGATVRADINSALQALASLSLGATEPSTMYAGQVWNDTTANIIKIRNEANNAWVSMFSFDGTTFSLIGAGIPVVTGAGTVDAITANYSPDITLADGLIVGFISAGVNTVTNPTFSPDGGTARTIFKKGGVALVAGDIGAAGATHFLKYTSASTRWELMNPCKVTEADHVFADNTTGNVSTSMHGFMPKAANSATTYYDSLGTQTNPALNAVLTGYSSGAGTVASTDTILQAIQKLNGNAAAVAAGVTQIAAGNCATGSPSAIDFTSIAQTYRGLVLHIEAASNDTATRGLKIDCDFGNGLGSSNNEAVLVQISNTTVTNVALVNSLWTVVTQTAAQVSSCLFEIMGYQNGIGKQFKACAAVAQTSGSSWNNGTNNIKIHGLFSSSAATHTAETRGLTGIRVTWDNVATGVFDAGTYKFFGIN